MCELSKHILDNAGYFVCDSMCLVKIIIAFHEQFFLEQEVKAFERFDRSAFLCLFFAYAEFCSTAIYSKAHLIIKL